MSYADSFTDEWGCVWSNLKDGNEAIVTGHPVKTEEDIYALKIPRPRDVRLPHGFMYLRLLDLCDVPFANMSAVLDAAEKYRFYKG